MSATNPVQVEVVVPVFNEEAILEASIRRLHTYLSDSVTFTWRIVIADNASTDGTLSIARELADELPGVAAMHVSGKGRGRALKAAWTGSPAEVVAYMDVDLSTDLRALPPLVAPLLSGHADVALGTRLAPGANVVRGAKREFISRAYNRLLRLTLRARFSDAQCGFKAARADVVRQLLPDIRDNEWFFDTELLVLAQRRGLRIHEVPVDWVDDTDSRVQVVATALEDLRGIARLAVPARVVRFMAIGLVSTLAYGLLFLLLRLAFPAGLANGFALAATAVGNTAANRRLTFGVRGRDGLARHHSLGAVIFLVTLGMTSGALALLHDIVARPSHALELAVLVVAGIVAPLTRYAGLASLVFAARPEKVSRVAPEISASRRGT
jgi:glycosyltransferase involved in cell wall biosynthesis